MQDPLPILSGAGPLLSRYDLVLCDVWGVVHDGHTAYEPAGDALRRFRRGGGTVVLLSNAPFPRERVEKVLRDKNVARDTWDAIVSSGDITIGHAEKQGYDRLHHLGPLPRDKALFERLPGRNVSLREAQAVVVSGLLNDRTETAENYRGLLDEALALKLPMICANPDLVVDVGGTLLPCAGAIAALYESVGGSVFWAGKPHQTAYDAALATGEQVRGRAVPKERILAIGDSGRTDIAGAVGAGIDALFVGHGIHRHEVMPQGVLDAIVLARLFDGRLRPIAAIPALAW